MPTVHAVNSMEEEQEEGGGRGSGELPGVRVV